MQTGLYVFDASEAMPDLPEIKEGVGVATKAATTIEVFPNPAQNTLSMRLPGGLSGNMDYAICNITGSIAARGTVTAKANGRTDLSLPPDLAPGFYILRSVVGGQSFVARFIKR
jgi:hypothetical protein